MAARLLQEDDVVNVSGRDATVAKYFEGVHEIESYEANQYLRSLTKRCSKHPNHKAFIPIQDFNISHLPPAFKDDDVLELIKAKADITVKLTVSFTSHFRPEFYPDTSTPYPFYSSRGTNSLKVGTGRIDIVFKLFDIVGSSRKVCRCKKCRLSGSRGQVAGEIRVLTARHVVYDHFEVATTECRLFFDEADSSQYPMVTLDGCVVVSEHSDADFIIFECVTCDAELVDSLHRKLEHYEEQWVKVYNKFKDKTLPQTLAIIVSHPHGCSKHVTVGKWLIRVEKEEMYTKYAYTTSTCPGSSGAEVLILGRIDNRRCYEHVHSGSSGEGYNFSGIGLEDLCQDD